MHQVCHEGRKPAVWQGGYGCPSAELSSSGRGSKLCQRLQRSGGFGFFIAGGDLSSQREKDEGSGSNREQIDADKRKGERIT